jgi:hypothetical protein
MLEMILSEAWWSGKTLWLVLCQSILTYTSLADIKDHGKSYSNGPGEEEEEVSLPVCTGRLLQESEQASMLACPECLIPVGHAWMRRSAPQCLCLSKCLPSHHNKGQHIPALLQGHGGTADHSRIG